MQVKICNPRANLLECQSAARIKTPNFILERQDRQHSMSHNVDTDSLPRYILYLQIFGVTIHTGDDGVKAYTNLILVFWITGTQTMDHHWIIRS